MGGYGWNSEANTWNCNAPDSVVDWIGHLQEEAVVVAYEDWDRGYSESHLECKVEVTNAEVVCERVS